MPSTKWQVCKAGCIKHDRVAGYGGIDELMLLCWPLVLFLTLWLHLESHHHARRCWHLYIWMVDVPLFSPLVLTPCPHNLSSPLVLIKQEGSWLKKVKSADLHDSADSTFKNQEPLRPACIVVLAEAAGPQVLDLSAGFAFSEQESCCIIVCGSMRDHICHECIS